MRDYLKFESLSPKALLLLDNAPSHPTCDTLVSSDGKIKCMFMPPNVTNLIKPMDQGVLENIKGRHKRDLLRKFLLESEVSFVNFAKTLTIEDAVYASSKCWKEVPVTALSRV